MPEGVISYPKIRALHYIEHLLKPDTHVVIQEKLDGSNVGIRNVNGELVIQSRTTVIDQSNPGMFRPVVEWANQHPHLATLSKDAALYGEMAVNQGKIKYDEKVPFVLFDVLDLMTNQFDDPTWWANELNVPVVTTLYRGPWGDMAFSEQSLRSSIGENQEGFVIKAYDITERWENPETGATGEVHHPLLGGKIVRDDFKEIKVSQTTMKDSKERGIEAIADMLVTDARVRKATQRVLEEGGDHTKGHLVIGKVAKDAHDEDEALVKDQLFKAYWPQINRLIAQRTLELHPSVVRELAA